MIRFGPSGIPLSCKGRTLRDSIEDVHNLGLTAMEIQMDRVNVSNRFAIEEEDGLCAKEIIGEMVVEALREEEPLSLDEPLEKGDVLFSLTSSIAKDYKELVEIGDIAKDLDVQLSMHTPYYLNLIAGPEDEAVMKSVRPVEWAGELAKEMGCYVVVLHAGLYADMDNKETSMDMVLDNISMMSEVFKEKKIPSKLGIETSGKQEVFGSVDEVLSVSKNVSGVIPVLNYAHIHAWEGGSLKHKDDFEALFDKVKKVQKNNFYSHFSGVEHSDGNEKRYTPIKRGDLKFEPLAEFILDNDHDMSIISSSPLLEHDAMYMRVIYERVFSRREAKKMRAEAKTSETNTSETNASETKNDKKSKSKKA